MFVLIDVKQIHNFDNKVAERDKTIVFSFLVLLFYLEGVLHREMVKYQRYTISRSLISIFYFDKTNHLRFFVSEAILLPLKLNSQYLLPEFCGRICGVVVGQCLVGCTVEGVEVVITVRPRQPGGERVRQVEQSPSDDHDVPDVEPERHDHGCVTNTFKHQIKNKSK